MRPVSKLAAQPPTKSMPDPVTPPSVPTQDWGVLNGLNAPNGQSIVEAFESLRGKMILYFEVRHCVDPEELADETLSRMMKKLCKGAEVPDFANFAYGFARNVFHEYLRKEKAKEKFVESLNRSGAEPIDDNDEAAHKEQRLQCLDGCLSRLSEQRRWILLEYYKYKGHAKLEHRRKMAEQLKISRAALTLKVFHLKQKLKACLDECLENVPSRILEEK